MDEGEISSRGYHAMTIRLYDPDAKTWARYRLTSGQRDGRAAGPRPGG